MEYDQIDFKQKKRKRRKKVLWIFFPVLLILGMLPIALSNWDPKPVFVITAISLFILGFADLIFLYFLSEKYYNWTIIFLLVFFTGLFFRRQHWPLAGTIISFGLIFLSLISIINSVRFLVTMPKNPFLKWFGSISSFIISIYSFSWLNRVQHWSGTLVEIFGYSGVFLFIIAVLAMVFTLPGSDYLTWTNRERKIFFRAILVPMIFIFALILIGNVFTNVYFWMLDVGRIPWDINSGIELHDLEGIPKLNLLLLF